MPKTFRWRTWAIFKLWFSCVCLAAWLFGTERCWLGHHRCFMYIILLGTSINKTSSKPQTLVFGRKILASVISPPLLPTSAVVLPSSDEGGSRQGPPGPASPGCCHTRNSIDRIRGLKGTPYSWINSQGRRGASVICQGNAISRRRTSQWSLKALSRKQGASFHAA